jgi:hypothetical protein
MEQNNFEKNVQHKLDELKIPPSDAVWANVEKHIGKKHKDRKLIFILFIVTVILLSGGYWLFNSTKNNAPQSDQVSQLKKDSKPTPPDRTSRAGNNEDSSFGKPEITSGNNYKNIDSASVSSRRTKNFKASSQNKIAARHEKKQSKLINDFSSESNKDYSKPTNNEDFQIVLNNKNKLFKEKTDIAEIENKNESENIADNIQNQISTDSFLPQLDSEKTIQKLIAKNASSARKKSAKEQLKRWNFGITFSAGSALIGSNILKRSYSSMDMYAGLPPAGPSNGGNPSYYYSPSPLKNSTAFIAGVFVERNLSAKTRISLGISYKYYSLINKVGNKIDSTLRSPQYLATNYLINIFNPSHTYRNNFHYLEVPVSTKIQINKNKKLPLFWNAGVNISQLISSNALQFKSDAGIYYSDNSMFNKTQLGLHTGLFLTLFAQQKTPFTFGPYFYYSATSLSDKGLYNRKHFSFIGIRTEILFRKK